MTYEIRLYREAIKALDRMDRKTEERIRRRLRELADNPTASRLSKPLKGMEGLRSSRVGEWRILYVVDELNMAVAVLAVRPRGQVYRRL
ncbi:MAG TPA: type II toxin-antitoxin system RelE/ParE family toxin [Thermosynergistes sp.]|nr:type II toxin-antitoxin system RelE/ParE family toxin [Thermosynergistes sp.]